MQAEIQFCPLTPADYDAVIALWKNAEGVEVAEGDDRASYEAYLARNPGLSRAAVSAGRIIGAMLCGHDGRRGLIYHLAVASEFRGQGLGRRLVEAGLGGLRAAGIQRVLILVERDNAGGREFWTAAGFEEISDALAMGRGLE